MANGTPYGSPGICTGVTCGNKVFFAGGLVNWPNASSTVDIFNTQGFNDLISLSVPAAIFKCQADVLP